MICNIDNPDLRFKDATLHHWFLGRKFFCYVCGYYMVEEWAGFFPGDFLIEIKKLSKSRRLAISRIIRTMSTESDPAFITKKLFFGKLIGLTLPVREVQAKLLIVFIGNKINELGKESVPKLPKDIYLIIGAFSNEGVFDLLVDLKSKNLVSFDKLDSQDDIPITNIKLTLEGVQCYNDGKNMIE